MTHLTAFVGREPQTFTNKGIELTGYPVYVRYIGFAPYTHKVCATLQAAERMAAKLNKVYKAI